MKNKHHVENFVGNKGSVIKITKWLNDFYNGKETKYQYSILYGSSGNGKSYLSELLSKDYNVELFTITSLDEEKIYDIQKSINLSPLSGQKRKLILVDDIDDFSFKGKKILYNLPQISIHPIIYTCQWISNLDRTFTNNALRLKLNKPMKKQLISHLKDKTDLSEEELDIISEKAKSVREAELASYNEDFKSLTSPQESVRNFVKKANKRQIEESLDRGKVKLLFNSIQGYSKDSLAVMERFAEFDYRTCVKFEDINSIFVNEMVEPIEKVNLKYQFKKPQKKKPIKLPKPKKPKKEKKPKADISDFI